MAGIGIALPWLEAMVGNRARAQSAPPLRYLLGFGGMSLGGYDGNIAQTFVPTTVGANYDLKAALSALMPVRDQVSVITGLRIPTAAENNGSVPAGGRPVAFHGNQLAPLLTGRRTQDGDFDAPTTDHLAAALIGGNTPFKPLVVRVQASHYVGSAAAGTGDVISYKQGTNGLQSVPARYSPQQLFQALFANFNGSGLTAAQVAEQEWLLRTRRSVLDSVASRASRLKDQLGTRDRQRLDAHFTEVRELEQRVASVPPPMVGLCQKPSDPGPDPALGSGQNTNSEGNITYSQNLGYSGEEQRASVMVEFVAMAMICDLTRSTLFQFTNSQSFLNMYSLTQQRSDLHELSHGSHGNATESDTTVALAKGINWHMKHWATLLGRLRDAREGDTSILDNTASVFTFEGGHGFDPADGRQISAHSTENMAAIVAGGAGGLKRGLHLRAPGMHPANVLLTALRALGSTQTSLGEVSGEIPGLR
ncbi:MAG: DUF1552 domain-containing protein [Archangium sp.]|nr:DUF1552 domain-containing protein [Archangium sp.]